MTTTWESKLSNQWMEIPVDLIRVGDIVIIDHCDERLRYELSYTTNGIQRMSGLVTEINLNWISVCIDRSLKTEDCCKLKDIMCCLKYQEPDFDLGI